MMQTRGRKRNIIFGPINHSLKDGYEGLGALDARFIGPGLAQDCSGMSDDLGKALVASDRDPVLCELPIL